MSKRPWIEGPWHAQFRHVVAYTKDKDHPMRYWPDCTGKLGDGEWDCCGDSEGKLCEFADECAAEWKDLDVCLSVTYLKNPGSGSQGDQVVHPIVDANAQLIALAPEMAEAILTQAERYPDCEIVKELAAKLNHIIDFAEKRDKRQAEWKAQQEAKKNGA